MDDVRRTAKERAKRPKTAPVGASFESERQRSKNALVKQLDSMDGRNVRKIAAVADAPQEEKILRVAAYCRVSTDDIDQAISIHLQIQEYKKKILANPNWKYVGTYVDDGCNNRTKNIKAQNVLKTQCFLSFFTQKTASKTKRVCLPKVALGSADALFSCPDAVTWHGQSVLHSTPTCSLTEPEGVLFCCPVWAGMEAKAMNGHIEDKPKDCRAISGSRQRAAPPAAKPAAIIFQLSAQRPSAAVSECDGCPYGRASPCIGWCTKELLRSMGTPERTSG